MVLVVSPVADSPAESMSCEVVMLSNQTKDLANRRNLRTE